MVLKLLFSFYFSCWKDMLFGSVETFEGFSPPKRQGEGLAEGHPQAEAFWRN